MSNFENMEGFLEHISLVNDSDLENTSGEISLMTLHASKGLEFDAVFAMSRRAHFQVKNQ